MLVSKNIQIEFSTLWHNEVSKQESKTKIKNYFRLNYLYSLNPEVEGLVYLRKIIDLSLKIGVNVLPFIPPVNYQLGEQLFGQIFRVKYEQNVEKIRQITKDKGVDILDMSYALETSMFAEPTTPDETANEFGRKKLAELLCSRL